MCLLWVAVSLNDDSESLFTCFGSICVVHGEDTSDLLHQDFTWFVMSHMQSYAMGHVYLRNKTTSAKRWRLLLQTNKQQKKTGWVTCLMLAQICIRCGVHAYILYVCTVLVTKKNVAEHRFVTKPFFFFLQKNVPHNKGLCGQIQQIFTQLFIHALCWTSLQSSETTPVCAGQVRVLLAPNPSWLSHSSAPGSTNLTGTLFPAVQLSQFLCLQSLSSKLKFIKYKFQSNCSPTQHQFSLL